MQKIVGWKWVGTKGNFKIFDPIYEEISDQPQEKCNDSWPFINTSRHIDTLEPLKFKEDGVQTNKSK